ncbi:MAG: sigma 54-interacting transcriptional regulator [Myxococcales bacterium]|nr:sigma 54-interacting transcriptional regulator [Myxococcales bacterium]MDP3502382.1 sigma 54-interacting transcriptional regulator [Myxococcales bacterium]
MVTVTLARPSFLRLGPGGHLARRDYELEVVKGPGAGRTLPLSQVTSVGSGLEAQLQLVDGTVSRLHVELTPRADGVLVRDLGSKNGTFIKGVRVSEASLERTTELELGRCVVRVRVVDTDDGAVVKAPGFGAMVGKSDTMQQLFGVLRRVSQSESNVLLLGETGTGKGQLAEAIHAASPRAKGPFVTLDCGALPRELVESTVFGHVAGAFTGAARDSIGLAPQAHGGVLFIDEVGELPLEVQPRLLRLLEARTVRPVGARDERRVDVRVIAATHRDLADDVKQGRFRQDLYFRLAVVEVRVPPLRERRDDVPLLAAHFLRKAGHEVQFTSALLERFAGYQWPGNVRELENVVTRVVSGLEPTDAPEPARGFKAAKERLVEAFTRDYLAALFERHGGNVSAIAREAGLNRNHVAELAVKLGLKSK